MVGIALEGGGAKGAYEVGAYLALKKYVKNIDMIAGTSIGAINAALFVQGNLSQAINMWKNVDSNVFGIAPNVIEKLKTKPNLETLKKGFSEAKEIIDNKGISLEPLKKLIDEAIDEEKVRNSKIKLGLVTVNLSDFKQIEITIDDIPQGKLKEYLLASCYLPIFKSEKIIDDKYYLDGGFYNNLPISFLEKCGCDKIYAIRLKSIGIIQKYKSKITFIKPNKSTGPMLLFNNSDVENNLKMGYLDTLKSLKKVLGKVYYFKKKKIYIVNVKKVSKQTLDLIKIKKHTSDYKKILYLAIEEILLYNKKEVLKIYEINKILKIIKKEKLKCKSPIVNDFISKVICLVG